MAMIFKQPGKTGMEILKNVSLLIKDKNHINKIVDNRNKRMKLNSTIFFLCAGLCSSALIENAFSMDDKVVSTRTFFNEKGKLGQYHMMIVSKYFEDIDDFRNLEFATPKAYKNTDKWHMNPISITPDQLHLWSGLQTLYLYTMEDLNNWWDYAPDEKFIDQLPSGNLKNANGLFYKVEIHVPYDMEEIKKSNLLDSMKDKFIYSTSTAKYPIRFRNVRVNRAADIGHVDPETGQFIFNDDVYTGYEKNKKISIGESDNSYVIRNIPDSCFEGFGSLKSILIPNSIKSIGRYAFAGCKNLQKLTIENNITTIGFRAFRCCTSLDNVTIPDSVTSIGRYAFAECKNLQNLTIGSGVETIGYSAFRGCSGLTSITITDSVISICKDAFGASTTVIVPRKSMAENLRSCGFKSEFVEGNTNPANDWKWPEDGHVTIPDNITEICDSMFAYREDIKSVRIPYGVKSIGEGAFQHCVRLTGVKIPDSVTSIGDWAFDLCINLTSVKIPDSVTWIGDWAFAGCTGLTEITIPDSVTFIGMEAFCGCNNLNKVYVYSDSVKQLVIDSQSGINPDIIDVTQNPEDAKK